MNEFITNFSDTIKLVNPELINLRYSENMIENIDHLCKEIEKLLTTKYVEYKGHDVDNTNYQVLELNRVKSKKKKVPGIVLSTKETYARTHYFKFKLKYKGDIENIKLKLYIPFVCDDGVNYYIGGNKYCVPFQLVDAVIYNRENIKNKFDEVVLKTEIRDIHFQRYEKNISDVDGNTFNCHQFIIKFNRRIKKVPFLLFYFASLGFIETLDYFQLRYPQLGVHVFDTLPPSNSFWRRDYYFFKFGSLYLSVLKIAFNSDKQLRDLMATIISTKRKSINSETYRNINFWKTSLGIHLSQSNSLSSGESLIKTFIDSLDPRTLKLIEVFLNRPGLRDMFQTMKWMFFKYSQNISKDSSLHNKRLRLSEYLIEPLKNYLTLKSYRFSQTSGGYRDIRRLTDVFKISPSIILDSIIGKGGMPTGKFSNSVNDLSIITILKGTQSGPGSPIGSGGGHAPKGFQELNTSMAGYLDMITTGTGMPGINVSLCPNCKVNSNLGFKK